MEASFAPEEIAQAITWGEASRWYESRLDSGEDLTHGSQALRHHGTTDLQNCRITMGGKFGRASIMSLLLSRGADIDATDAAEDGRVSIAESLAETHPYRR